MENNINKYNRNLWNQILDLSDPKYFETRNKVSGFNFVHYTNSILLLIII